MTWRDDEILDWVEGELPEARREAFERAMAGDAGLARLARGMRADRAALREAVRGERLVTPVGLVEEAIERAEREAVVGGENWSFEVATRRRGLGVMRGLAVAASMIVVIGGAAIVLRGGNVAGPASPGAPGALALQSAASEDGAAESGARPDTAMLAVVDEEPERPAASVMVASAEPSDLMLPLAGPVVAAIEAMESMPRASWSGRGFETVRVGGRTREMLADREPLRSTVAPASYEDALRLAALNGLAVRVMATDPEAVEAGVRALAARAEGVGAVRAATLRDGSMLVWVDVDGGASGLKELLAAVQRPAGSEARAVFEPTRASGSSGGGTMLVGMGAVQPVIEGARSVRVPVRIERASFVHE